MTFDPVRPRRSRGPARSTPPSSARPTGRSDIDLRHRGGDRGGTAADLARPTASCCSPGSTASRRPRRRPPPRHRCAEVKSMYVAPAYRGQASRARCSTSCSGRRRARLQGTRLDTSDYLTAAVALYRSAGYARSPTTTATQGQPLVRTLDPWTVDARWPSLRAERRRRRDRPGSAWIHHVGSTGPGRRQADGRHPRRGRDLEPHACFDACRAGYRYARSQRRCTGSERRSAPPHLAAGVARRSCLRTTSPSETARPTPR